MRTTNRQGPGSAWLFDLLTIGTLSVFTALLLLSLEVPEPVVWLVSIPFVLVYPGYAFVSALFPEHGVSAPLSGVRPSETPDFIARIALALVTSPILVAILAAGLSPLSAIQRTPLVIGLTAITLGCIAVALVRRKRLPIGMRAGFPRREGDSIQLLPGTSGQNSLLVVSVLVLAIVGLAVLAVPPTGEAYSEAYLLGENEDGEFVADEYPTEMTVGEEYSLAIGIENHEHSEVTYEVHTLLQALDENHSVTNQQRLDRFDVVLDDGERTISEREIAPTLTGDLRVQVLVYEETSPETPSAETADHVLQVWVTVDSA